MRLGLRPEALLTVRCRRTVRLHAVEVEVDEEEQLSTALERCGQGKESVFAGLFADVDRAMSSLMEHQRTRNGQ